MNIDLALALAEPLVFGAEGCRLTAYLDTLPDPPRWTIGHGSTWIDGRPVESGMTCTKLQADAWAAADLRNVAELVMKLVKVTINEHQLAALTSLAFNIGVGGFEHSTVLEALNLAFIQRAADRFLEYDKAGGRTIVGLETRRARERALFLTGVSTGPAAKPPEKTTDELNEAELNKLDSPDPPPTAA